MNISESFHDLSKATEVFCQRAVFYFNWLNFPPGVPYTTPEKPSFIPLFYPGIPTAKCYKVVTDDRVKIGLWHITPHNYHENQPIERLVFFFHGNTANRGFMTNRRRYSFIIGDGRTHVVTFDYRGFGDSEGSVSEEGTLLDGKAFYDWITKPTSENGLGVSPNKVVFWGHSLGSGIASEFVSRLEGRHQPSALVLEAAFLSTSCAIQANISFLPSSIGHWISNRFVDRYSTRDTIMSCTCPVLLLHGLLDRVVPFEQGKELFELAKQRDGCLGSQQENIPSTEFVLSKGASHESLLLQSDVQIALRKFIDSAVP